MFRSGSWWIKSWRQGLSWFCLWLLSSYWPSTTIRLWVWCITHTHTHTCTHTRMHACTHAHTHTHTHTTCTHSHTHSHICSYACTHAHTRTHTHTHTCTQLCMHTHILIHNKHTYIYAHRHMHMHACTYRHTCMHTHTRTHTIHACTHAPQCPTPVCRCYVSDLSVPLLCWDVTLKTPVSHVCVQVLSKCSTMYRCCISSHYVHRSYNSVPLCAQKLH